MKKYVVLAAFTICTATASYAATLTAQITTSSGNVGFDPIGNPVPIANVDRSEINESPERAFASGGGRASGDFGTAGGAAEASADATVGELKVRAIGESTNSNPSRLPSGFALAFAEIRQDFIVNGTGFITSNLLVDVEWGGVGQKNFDARTIIFSSGSTPGNLAFGEDGLSSGRIVNELINGRSFIQGAQDLSVTILWSLWANVSGGNQFLDASNTGTIFFSASDGLSVVPTTPSFLSEATYPDKIAPVPLPASGLLLFGGLGLAALVRFRSRTVGGWS